MAYDNAQMAAALGELLGLNPEQITELQGDLDQWALGGARLATYARLATDVSLFNDAAVRMVFDWYGGTADGGPGGDGLYPLMNSEAEVFFVPSPARLQADLTGFEPNGQLPNVGALPATGEQGDVWIIAGNAWGWNTRQAAWKNMGPFQGGTGAAGVISGASIAMLAPGAAPTVTLGGTPSDRTIAFGVPAAADGDDGVTPNVSAEVAMITAGQPALVTRSGPDATPVFTFQLPRAANGTDGREVELQPGATHLQWRYVGAPTWANLFARAEFKGDKGDRGDAFEFGAKPADLAGRVAYDAEGEGFTVLVMDTGTVYARVGAAPGVWSDGFPFGQAQNAILEALSELNATPGLLYQSGADAFEKRAIGVASDADIPDRLAGDSRWRRQGVAVPMAEVSGLADELDDKADAAAVLVLLGGKEDKSAKGAANGYAGLGADSKVPASQQHFATVAEVWAGAAAGLIIDPKTMADSLATVVFTPAQATTGLDFNAFTNAQVVLTASITLGAPAGGYPGKTGILTINNNAAGTATLAFHANYRLPDGGIALKPGANSTTRIPFQFGGAGVVNLFPASKWA